MTYYSFNLLTFLEDVLEDRFIWALVFRDGTINRQSSKLLFCQRLIEAWRSR